MVAGNQQFVLQFTANTSQMTSSLKAFSGTAKTLLNEIQTVASRPININATAQSSLLTGDIRGAAAALAPQFSQIGADVSGAAVAGGATRVQGGRLAQQAVNQAVQRTAGAFGLTADQQAELQRTVQRQILVTNQAATATGSVAAERFREAELIKAGIVRERTSSEAAIRAKAQRVVAEQQQAEALRRLTRQEARLAGLRGAEARAAISRASQAGPGAGTSQTPNEFLRGGFRSTLRFAIPSAILFGTASGISAIVKESEELEQINVRLAGQFKNLGTLGTFDGLLGEIGLAVTELNRTTVAAAQLDDFREAITEVSFATGITSDKIFELGGAFVGFFSSLDGADKNLSGLAAQATRISAEFSVITGLDTETAFNDLTASVRVFSTGGVDLNSQLAELSDNLVSVSDTSGVAAGELADFVGRIAPIAQTAGFAAEEVAAIGGALLQASGLGGAVLAEQFGRIISTFGEGLDQELADLAIEVPDLGLNLDDIFSGNTRDVLFQLVNGFDELSEAQQRQVIASIGSRREGNTLATLLTNQQGVFQGLASQQDNAGAASERFADVSETLTVKFNQLKVQFEKLGLALLQGGLGEILQDFVALISVLADSLKILIPVFGAFAKLTGLIPSELAALGIALLIANRTLIGFGGALAGAGQSLRSLRIGAAINEIGTNASASAAGVGKLSASFRILNGALGIVMLAFTAFQLIRSVQNKTDEDLIGRQSRLTDSLREAGNQYVTIADRARKYNEELERTADLQSRVVGTDGVLSMGSPAAAASAGLGQGIRDIAGDKDALGELLILIEGSGLGLNQIAAAAVESAPSISLLKKEYDGLADSATTAANRAGGAITLLNAVYGDAELSDDTRALAQGLREVVLQSEEGFEAVRRTVSVLDELASDNKDLIAEAAVEVGLALTQLSNQSTTDQAVRDRIAELFATQRALGGAEGDLVLIAGAEQLFPEFDDEAAAQQARAQFAAEVSEGLVDLAQVRAQLDAGVSTNAEFVEAASITVQGLREQLESAQSVLGNNPEQATRIIGEITAINEELASLAIEAFESAEEVLGLLGQDGRSVDRLLGLALDVDVQRSPDEFRSVVVELIEKEKEVALEAAGRAQSAEAAAALLGEFELSPELQDLFVETQLRSDASPIIQAVALALGADIDATFDLITAQIQAGRSLEQALRNVLLQELETLQGFLQGGGGGAFAGSGVVDRINAIQSQLEGLSDLEVPTIASGDQVGLDGDAVANVVDSLNDQYASILEGIKRDSQILSAFGIDNRPESLASQAAQLFTLLSDPNFTDSEARFEVAVQLAGVLQSIASLQGEELAAANEAVQLLTAGADVNQLVTAEAVFASITSQSSAFNQYLNTYLEVGEETLNALNRNIANFVAGGATAAQALALASQIAIRELERQIELVRISIFASGFGGGDTSAARQRLDILVAELESLSAASDAGGVPDIDIGGVSVGNVTPAGSSSSAADSARDTAADLAAAQFELLRAQFALDPVALARIAQDEAAAALANAKTAADRVRAQAQRLNANREFAQAVRDVFSAQTNLAISLANIAGNTEEALRLGVVQARRELRFLRRQGAGEAAIASAEQALAEAQETQFEGIIKDQIGDLDFLFKIGELTTQQYIAQLEGILSTLDPIADKDLFRDITLQIQDLRNRTNDLSTNLGNFDIPSLFEVRRLAATGFGGTPDQAGPGGRVDNRTINVTMNISDGVSWEDAVNVINDAIGTDAPVTFEGRRY